MKEQILPTVTEMHNYAEKMWGKVSMGDEGRFFDAFRYGEFHEERPDWIFIAERLSDEALATLFLPITQALVSGGKGFHEGGQHLATLMECFFTIGKWQREGSSHFEEVRQKLENLRPLLFAAILENRTIWFVEVLVLCKTVEYGVLTRLKHEPHDVMTKYEDFEDSLVFTQK